LVIKQLLGEYEVKKDDLISYYRCASRLLSQLETVKLEHVPRSANKVADALANLAATLALGAEENMNVPVCNRWVVAPIDEELEKDVNAVSAQEVDGEDWCQPLIDYLHHGKLPNDPRHRTEIQRRAPRFFYFNGTLYWRSFLGIWLRCLGNKAAGHTMEEAHSGICGTHQAGPKLYD